MQRRNGAIPGAQGVTPLEGDGVGSAMGEETTHPAACEGPRRDARGRPSDLGDPRSPRATRPVPRDPVINPGESLVLYAMVASVRATDRGSEETDTRKR